MRLALLTFASLLFAVPAAAQEAASHAVLSDPEGEPIVIGSAHRIQSSVYGDEQLLTVRLPRGYADNPEKNYPVVFSVDGGPDQDFELLSGIAAEAEFSTSFEPFILIGVQTTDRYSQLTPEWTGDDAADLEEQFGGLIKPGGGDRFRDYLATDVIPWATARYRTERKILTSVSLGGLFVLDSFLKRPDLFDDYIALTPSLWWDGGRFAKAAAAKMATHAASDRRVYFTMADEGVGNLTGDWLETMVAAFQTSAPEGVKWAFVDRSGAEEHRTMALTGWLDAFRTLYLQPGRTGSSLPLVYADGTPPAKSAAVQANLDAGDCRHDIARPVTYTEKNAAPDAWYAWCVLMKPGERITAGNFGPEDFGRGKLVSE